MRTSGWGATVVAVVLLSACAGSSPTVHERFEASRVEVTIHLERKADATTVVAEFRPLQADLHLYGFELPVDGINGAGRPTRVDVVDESWHAVGPPQPSVVAEDVTLTGFDQPFPTYPDGPVRLRQAVELLGTIDDGRIDLAITFMACSSAGLCFPPVERHPMSLPAS